MRHVPNAVRSARRGRAILTLAAVLSSSLAAQGAAQPSGLRQPAELAANQVAANQVATVALAEAGCNEHRCGASLGAQFDHSDLVFEGIVRRVETRLSDASTDGTAPRLPVTYVTFDIAEVFFGIAPQREPGRITIRILGGPAPDGRVLTVSGRPLFGVGQRDILMVRANHRGVASVQHGSNRRFRIDGTGVFFESGREILAAPGGELRAGALHRNPKFDAVQIGAHTMQRVVGGASAEAPEGVAGRDGVVRLGAEDLRAALRLMARGTAPEKLRTTKLVRDVSIAERFELGQSLRRNAKQRQR